MVVLGELGWLDADRVVPFSCVCGTALCALLHVNTDCRLRSMTNVSLHYGFCPLVKLTFKDLAKLTAFAAIFKTKSYFR